MNNRGRSLRPSVLHRGDAEWTNCTTNAGSPRSTTCRARAIAAGAAGGPGTGLAADAADAARPAEPRPARRRLHHLQPRTATSSSTPTSRSAPSSRRFASTTRPSTRASCSEYAGRAAIGHVRYATCGANDRSYAQPFERHHGCKWKWFRFAFNGQLANFAELRDELLDPDRLPPDARTSTPKSSCTTSATSCAATTGPTWCEVFRNLSQQVRRRLQHRLPERHGRHGRRSAIRRASGRSATPRTARCSPPPARACRCSNLGFQDVQSLEPGEMIVIQDNELRLDRFAPRADAVALLLRVDLLRQRRQHARRPQRLPAARRPGQGAGPAGAQLRQGAARRRHHRRAGARHGQGRRRRDGLRAGRAVGRRADAQSLHRPHVHRGRRTGPTACS